MSTAWYSKKWVNVLLHAAAWVLLFSLPYLLRPSLNEGRMQRPEPPLMHLRYAINNLIYVGFFYLNALWLIPHFIYKRKYKQWAAIIIVCFLSILFITWLTLFLLMEQGQSTFNVRGHILFNFFFFLFFLTSSTAYRMIKDRARADRIAREKENENLKTELSLLRSQVSPHFMFNIMNNMVALARKKSDLLEPSLLKLSSLLRYMLYETDEKVPLQKEIEYLQSYIDLQKQRFGDNVHIQAAMQNVDQQHEIEPMLLIPFVENAFKHGTSTIQDAAIDIEMKTEKNMLSFSVRNKFNENTEETKDKSSGIGLPNVQRRLDLLYGNKQDRKSTRLNSSHSQISYAVFCLKKKKKKK